MADRVNDLLLPIVKGVGSERSWELLGTESLQTFGGSGFLQDYPIEQYVRDAKIDTLYEGTTAIQGLDFFFRKIVRDKGQALAHLSTQIQEFAKAGEGDRARHRARAAGQGAGGRAGHRRLHGRRADEVRPAPGGWRRHQPLQGRPEHHAGCCWPPATWSSAGCCCARPRSPSAALEPAPRRQGPARSTRARSRPRASSPGPCCPSSPPSAQIAEATDNALMDVPEDAF